MSVASDLVKRHIETLVADNAHWQTLLADDIVWELPFAPSLGHPGKVVGRDAVIRQAAEDRHPRRCRATCVPENAAP